MSEKETDQQLIDEPESGTVGKTEMDGPEESSSAAVDPPSNSGGN